MTRPLDGLALHTYCRRLGLSQDAETLIATIRSSPPHRNPRGNHGNMLVWYPSKKMGCVIKAESHRVEFAFLLEAEYADDVLEYFDQPHPPMQLEYLDKQGRRQTPLHTADYLCSRIIRRAGRSVNPSRNSPDSPKSSPIATFSIHRDSGVALLERHMLRGTD